MWLHFSNLQPCTDVVMVGLTIRNRISLKIKISVSVFSLADVSD